MAEYIQTPKGEQHREAVVAELAMIYARLDVCRTLASESGRIASGLLEQKDVELIERVAGATNAAIGGLLCIKNRMLGIGEQHG